MTRQVIHVPRDVLFCCFKLTEIDYPVLKCITIINHISGSARSSYCLILVKCEKIYSTDRCLTLAQIKVKYTHFKKK